MHNEIRYIVRTLTPRRFRFKWISGIVEKIIRWMSFTVFIFIFVRFYLFPCMVYTFECIRSEKLSFLLAMFYLFVSDWQDINVYNLFFFLILTSEDRNTYVRGLGDLKRTRVWDLFSFEIRVRYGHGKISFTPSIINN